MAGERDEVPAPSDEPRNTAETDDELPAGSDENAPEQSEVRDDDPEGGAQKREPIEFVKYRQERRALREQVRQLQETVEKLATPAKPAEAHAPKPRREDFDDYDVFRDALTEWMVDARIKAERETLNREFEQRQRERTQADVNAQWAAKREAAVDKHTDYLEIEESVGSVLTTAAANAVKRSDAGPEIVMYLGKNPQVLEKLAGLDPTRTAIEIGKIEATLSSRERSRAPRPASSVRANARPVNKLSDDQDVNTWMAERRRQVRS